MLSDNVAKTVTHKLLTVTKQHIDTFPEKHRIRQIALLTGDSFLIPN